MRLHQLILFVLALAVLPTTCIFTSEETVFRFHGAVTCNLRKDFGYYINAYEVDGAVSFDEKGRIVEGRNEYMGSSGYHLRATSPHKYDFKGKQAGDGFLNNHYEIALNIRHTCCDDCAEFDYNMIYLPNELAVDAFEHVIEANITLPIDEKHDE
ncbi:unnamed protein product [Caenorhabditis sp. 36 PRJEB53466]|nr:unnamed protein product [Caenorhabditis sp. 36 PRJEB53466]